MSNKRSLRRIPPEGANPNLNDGELFGRIFDLQVSDVSTVELERISPWRAGDSGHLEIDSNEVALPDSGSDIGERGVEVGLGHLLHSDVGGGGGGGGGR